MWPWSNLKKFSLDVAQYSERMVTTVRLVTNREALKHAVRASYLLELNISDGTVYVPPVFGISDGGAAQSGPGVFRGLDLGVASQVHDVRSAHSSEWSRAEPGSETFRRRTMDAPSQA